MKAQTLIRSAAIAVMAGGLVTAAAAPAAAQSSGGQTQQQIKTDWSDQKLDAFADASVAIQEMQKKWQQRIRNADSDDEKRAVRQQANDALKQAIRDAGLTSKEYNQIYQATQKDESVRQDVLERIQAKNSE